MLNVNILDHRGEFLTGMKFNNSNIEDIAHYIQRKYFVPGVYGFEITDDEGNVFIKCVDDGGSLNLAWDYYLVSMKIGVEDFMIDLLDKLVNVYNLDVYVDDVTYGELCLYYVNRGRLKLTNLNYEFLLKIAIEIYNACKDGIINDDYYISHKIIMLGGVMWTDVLDKIHRDNLMDEFTMDEFYKVLADVIKTNKEQ